MLRGHFVNIHTEQIHILNESNTDILSTYYQLSKSFLSETFVNCHIGALIGDLHIQRISSL